MKSTTKKCSTSLFKNLTLLSLFLFLILTTGHSRDDAHAYLLTAKRGVLYSDNGGRSWEEVNKGLPEKILPLRLYSIGKTRYLVTDRQGIYRIDEGSNTWKSINCDAFKKRSLFFPDAGYRKISAFASDSLKKGSIALATKHSIYLSLDRGNTWKRLRTPGLQSRNYITALALRGGRIYAGTSFNGFYRLSSGRYRRLNRGLPQEPYSGSLHFTEELTAFAHDEAGRLYGGFRFGAELRLLPYRGRRWQKIKLPENLDPFTAVSSITCRGSEIYISTGSNVYKGGSSSPRWEKITPSSVIREIPGNIQPLSLTLISKNKNHPPLFFQLGRVPAEKKRLKGAGRRSIYASVPSIRRRLGSLIKTMKTSNFNAIVIDMKDDFGNLYYPTKIKTARQIRSARRPLNVKQILQRLKKNNIYTIARIVVFKDKKLFRAYGGKYTIRNRKTRRPWRGNPREYWVDPHSQFVQDYNIAIGRELEKLGFDEIQFDYIRFPSDGPTWLCHYHYKKDPEMYKSEILADFLTRARNALTVPISTDIYGFNSWYSFGNWIGQDMEEFSRIVDVISPMVYPSHFGRRFYMKGKRELRPYRIVHDGGKRAVDIAAPETVIRPYLQAFRMMSPTWGTGYILNQVRGARESGCSGFTFWNARGKYSVVEKAFQKKSVSINR